MDLFQHFGHLVLSVGLFVSAFFAHSRAIHNQNYHIYQQQTPATSIQQNSGQVASSSATPSASSSASTSFYTAARNINSQGHSIHISVNIPKEGGTVTGTISGDCSGNITGQYDGKDDGSINGQANVSCKYLFVRLPGTATFNGTVNKSDSIAQLYITLDFNSTEISQNVYINLE